jgi:TonB family protein
MTWTTRLTPLQLSLLIHGTLLAMFGLMLLRPSKPQLIEVPIYSRPMQEQVIKQEEEKPKVVLKSVNQQKQFEQKSGRQVFGINRQSLTSPDEVSGVEAKKGNTLTKEVDRETLTEDDPDSLPVPTEEYLVNEMPSVSYEVRPTYPPQARQQGLEGVVTLSILIDAEGKVRDIQFIEGPELFRQGAIEAMAQFRFRPAKVEGQGVAVRIRYKIRFSLDY